MLALSGSLPDSRAQRVVKMPLLEFDGGERDQQEEEPNDPEANDHFGLWPAEVLEVVMQGGATKDAALVEVAKTNDLKGNRERFGDQNGADEAEEKFAAQQHCRDADRASK